MLGRKYILNYFKNSGYFKEQQCYHLAKPTHQSQRYSKRTKAIPKSIVGCVATHHIVATLAWTFARKSAVTPLEINYFLFVPQKSTTHFNPFLVYENPSLLGFEKEINPKTVIPVRFTSLP